MNFKPILIVPGERDTIFMKYYLNQLKNLNLIVL